MKFPPNEAGEQLQMPRKAFEAAVFHALHIAADNKDRDNRGQSALLSPMRHLDNAAKECDRARAALGDIGNHHGFDLEKLRRAAEDYQRSHDELIMVVEQLGVSGTEDADA
ncbi:hypothetical protein [Sciscionella marina]|uniref:hypothetical protein n=1 Tax=Sciscionella marina TaxID=508770 RepID=UPI000382A0DF|nr:hypothetical protein [Sciscionella marina]